MTVTKSDPKHLPAMRLPDMPLHDPFVVADDRTRTYYLYTSNDPTVSGVDGTGTMVYRSADLRDWTRPVVVFRTAEQKGIWATEGAWAPEVHAWDGRYYLLTTLHDEDKPLDVPPANRWGTPSGSRTTCAARSQPPPTRCWARSPSSTPHAPLHPRTS